MNRKLEVITALAVLWLTCGVVASKATEARRHVVILKDAAAGVDGTTADAVAEALLKKFAAESRAPDPVPVVVPNHPATWTPRPTLSSPSRLTRGAS